MTKEELKQKAEAEADKVIIGSGMDRASVIHLKHLLVTMYMQGATENGIQWHDLRKDPSDLPKDNCRVLVRLEKPIMKFSYFCHSEKKFSAWNKEYGCNIQLHNVIAWCELPQFKE